MKRIFVTAAVFLLAGLAVHADEPQKTGWPLTEAERAYVLKPEHERCLLVAAGADALLEKMRSFEPPGIGKWMERLKAEER